MVCGLWCTEVKGDFKKLRANHFSHETKKRAKNRNLLLLSSFHSRAHRFSSPPRSYIIMDELLALLEGDDADDLPYSKTSSPSFSFSLRRLLKHAKYLREGCKLNDATVSRAALRDSEAIEECCKRVRACKSMKDKKHVTTCGIESTMMTASLSPSFARSPIIRGRQKGHQREGGKNTRTKIEQDERVQTNASTSSSSSRAKPSTTSLLISSSIKSSSSIRERRARDIERAKTRREERERKAKEKKEKEEKEANAKRMLLTTRAKEAKRLVLSRENTTKDRKNESSDDMTEKTKKSNPSSFQRRSPRSRRERKRPSYMNAVREKDVDAQTVLTIEEVLEALIAATVRSASNAAWKRAKMLATQAKVKEREILASIPVSNGESDCGRTKTATPATTSKKEKKATRLINFVDVVKAAAKESALQKRNRERKEEKERDLAEKKRLEKIAFKKQREKAELLRVKLEELRKEKERLEDEKKREMKEKKRIADEKKAWREDRQRRRDQAALEVARNAREKAEVNAFVDALVNEIVRDFSRKAPVLRVPVDIRRRNRRQQDVTV